MKLDDLKKDISDLMKETNTAITYSSKNDSENPQWLSYDEIANAKIPKEKLDEIYERLKERKKEGCYKGNCVMHIFQR